MTLSKLLPSKEIQNIISEHEPNYKLKTIIVDGVEMVEASEVENLLTTDQFKKLVSEINEI